MTCRVVVCGDYELLLVGFDSILFGLWFLMWILSISGVSWVSGFWWAMPLAGVVAWWFGFGWVLAGGSCGLVGC